MKYIVIINKLNVITFLSFRISREEKRKAFVLQHFDLGKNIKHLVAKITSEQDQQAGVKNADRDAAHENLNVLFDALEKDMKLLDDTILKVVVIGPPNNGKSSTCNLFAAPFASALPYHRLLRPWP